VLFYHKSIQIDSHNHRYYVLLSNILLKLSRFEEALFWAKALKNLNPQHVVIQDMLGSLFALLSKFDESADCCKSILSIDPKSEKALQSLTYYCMAMGRLHEAKHYAF
jgi:tetratricopeptide (TPR) repeat protein